MNKLSKIMNASLLASTVATTTLAHAEEQNCMEAYSSHRDRGECLIEKTKELGHVTGSDAIYVLDRAHEINVYDPIYKENMGTLNLHWGSIQEEASESYGNITDRPDYAQRHFSQAVQETCKGIKEQLKINGDDVKAEVEAYGAEYTYRRTNPGLRPDDYTKATRKIQDLELFTQKYCPDFE